MNALSLSHVPRSSPKRPLDQNLRSYLVCVAGFWKFYNTVYDSLHLLVEAALRPDARYLKLI